MTAAQLNLRTLRDRPYDLLRELERRGRAVAGGLRAADGADWVGVAFRIGPEAFLAPREDVREVMAYPAQITRVPGARSWIRGLCSLRGQLLPIVDLRHFLGSGVTPTGRTSRILVVNHRDVPAGLLVDEVLGFRRFSESEHNAFCPPTLVRCERFVSGAFRRATDSWPVMSLRKLVEDPSFLQAAA